LLVFVFKHFAFPWISTEHIGRLLKVHKSHRFGGDWVYHSNKCWVVLTQIWVKYGQTRPLG